MIPASLDELLERLQRLREELGEAEAAALRAPGEFNEARVRRLTVLAGEAESAAILKVRAEGGVIPLRLTGVILETG